MIILTAEQAGSITGPTSPTSALVPVPLADGVTWVLPVEVLSDPAHASRHAELVEFPQRDVASSEFPRAE